MGILKKIEKRIVAVWLFGWQGLMVSDRTMLATCNYENQ